MKNTFTWSTGEIKKITNWHEIDFEFIIVIDFFRNFDPAFQQDKKKTFAEKIYFNF